MITYSTNFMGPISMDWYRERGLVKPVSVVLQQDQVFFPKGLRAGDTWTYEEITTHYAGGRIDIRDSSKEGYDGWDEYSIAPMHGEDWNALGEWLWELTTDTVWSYNTLIETFEEHYGKKIRWADES